MASEVTAAPTLGLDALTVLDRLTQLHLVCVAVQAPHNQFKLLHTIRNAARAGLHALGETRQTVERLAKAAIRRCEIFGNAPQTPAVCAALDEDRDVLHVALRKVLTYPPEDQVATVLALRLATGLQPYWEVRGDAAQGRALLSQALGRPGGGVARLHATIARGALATIQSDWVAALLDLAPAHRLLPRP
ncbi:hypothetical protein ACFFLM_18315 [Deinococcus oregonensis]|uniref:Uncharacterized protein n=1 Tax=Deinococcus oregonensis TaxID=1805970 RepID=A0ABV6B2B9_9DEIO